MSSLYDYIIVGAGSAGCALAARLAWERPKLRILVLEAGGPDKSFMLKMPAGFASLGEKTPYNWHYETTPQKHCNDRRMYWPRGKTLGGSSAINAMLYVRGHASDYDHWRQLGNEGWSYEDVLPYFKKSENNERGADAFHGTGGPLNVADQVDPSKLNEAFLKAAGQAGHKRTPDFNGAEQEGVGLYQVTQKNKERWSAASAYLRPAVANSGAHLEVVTGALVERIIFDQKRAMGVRYTLNGRDEVARVTREIILCGGAVNSPQLLMLSGVGPADHLKSIGIRPLHDLPGVGGNLQDHLDAALLQFCRTRDTYDRANKLASLYQYVVNKKGPGTSPIAESGGFLRTRPELAAPDIQLHFLPVLVMDHGRTRLN
ncbi:MAG: GMC family oxidoreductase N-terminal domain-containing protein, partial [Reyranella sp.]|nr:GMC family oxidoreductase N-terminal domain-containing protein [Reyranella sp.]